MLSPWERVLNYLWTQRTALLADDSLYSYYHQGYFAAQSAISRSIQGDLAKAIETIQEIRMELRAMGGQ